MEKKTNGSERRKKAVLTVILIASIILMGVSAFIAIRKFVGDARSRQAFDHIRDRAVTDEKDSEIPVDVDWDELKAINPDIVAWLYIGCIDVSYPVLYKDDWYYLRRAVDGTWSDAGCLFIEEDNHPDFSDPNTIIYGHNMIDGTMFGCLAQIAEQGLWQEDPYFWVLTPEGNYKYRMFSSYLTLPQSDAYALFYTPSPEFAEWCRKMKQNSSVEFGDKTFAPEDQVVMLSTCGATSASRMVVFGYLDQAFLSEMQLVEE